MTKLDLQLWTKAPKYEDVVRAIEKDYKVKLPERTALTFWDSFAMSHYRDMVAGLEGGQEAGRSHQQMEAAMEQAAGEEGVTRREMMTFMDHLRAQSTGAAAQLQRNLDDATAAHHRALAEQGERFARALADESQRADRRERVAQQAAQALREAPQTAPSLAPAPAPVTQVVNNYHTTHNNQIQARGVDQDARRDGELAQLREGQGGMGRAIGELIQHMQGEGANVRQILGALANQPRQLVQQIANVDARSVTQVMNLLQQYNDARRADVDARRVDARALVDARSVNVRPRPRRAAPLAIQGPQPPPPPPPGAGAVAVPSKKRAPLAILDAEHAEPRKRAPPAPPAPPAPVQPSQPSQAERFFIGDKKPTAEELKRGLQALARKFAERRRVPVKKTALKPAPKLNRARMARDLVAIDQLV
jgi:hypothetical protein